MINVGVIGLGTMGKTHLDVYASRPDVKVIAISDTRPDRLAGKGRTGGNVAGQAQGIFDHASARHYLEAMDLINDPQIALVDVCVPTPQHAQYAAAVLHAGKHLIVEKPIARRSTELKDLLELADRANGFSMVAHCMRFWPGWVWLKETVDAQTHGNVLAAHFRRVASHPGGTFYGSGAQAGGAVLDMHIHDTDFIHFCFGMPRAVTTSGYSKITSELDHLLTRYHYPDIPMVIAEGGWVMAPGFPFTMQYTINFERATATFDLDRPSPLILCEHGKAPRPIPIPPGMGYQYEIAYMLDCIIHNRRPSVVTLRDAARTLDIIEAEIRSAATGNPEPICNRP